MAAVILDNIYADSEDVDSKAPPKPSNMEPLNIEDVSNHEHRHALKMAKKRKLMLIGLAVAGLILIFVIIALVVQTPKKYDEPMKFYWNCTLAAGDNITEVTYRERIDEANVDECRSFGCVYNETHEYSKCVYPDHDYGYRVKEEQTDGSWVLEWAGETPIHATQIRTLVVTLEHLTNAMFRVKVVNTKATRYEIPIPLDLPSHADRSNPLYIISTARPGEMFWITVTRRSSGEVIFDTRNTVLVYLDGFLEFTTILPSDRLYGLGERGAPFRRSFNHVRMPLFAHDNYPSPIGQNINLYSSMPFYMVVEEDGGSHGVMIYNSNAMEAYLTPTPALTARMLGGIIDLVFFLGPEPLDVTEQLTDIIGKPVMPPLWAIGFHLCRYDYKSLENTKKVFTRNWEGKMPMDVQWQDIDYMNKKLIFTVDNVAYDKLEEFVKTSIHGNNLHYVIIVDPAVGVKRGFDVYERGVFNDVYIKNATGQDIIGKVWPGNTVFPDFTNPTTTKWWKDEVIRFRENQLKFDGIWLDMNEPASFMPGSLDGCPNNTVNYPIYKPNTAGPTMFHKTICMDAQQHQGLHRDLHNLYGITETMATYDALLELFPGKKPFIISRSTFLGSGRYAGHWLGDNESNYKHLRQSIIGILDFGLFGMPMVGADIGGFAGNCTEQLALRWHQLGAWYPFCRNHNNDKAIDQDPAVWPKHFEDIKKAIDIRYRFLHLWYTMFREAHITGRPIIRATFQNFPGDAVAAHRDFDREYTQFMVGNDILVAPVVEEDVKETTVYLPPSATWYKYSNGTFRNHSQSGKQDLGVPLTELPFFARGGSVFVEVLNGRNTFVRNSGNFRMSVLPDANYKASGHIYMDDDGLKTSKYAVIKVRMEGNKENSTISIGILENGNYKIENQIDLLMVHNVPNVKEVTVNNKIVTTGYRWKDRIFYMEEHIKTLNESYTIAIKYT